MPLKMCLDFLIFVIISCFFFEKNNHHLRFAFTLKFSVHSKVISIPTSVQRCRSATVQLDFKTNFVLYDLDIVYFCKSIKRSSVGKHLVVAVKILK